MGRPWKHRGQLVRLTSPPQAGEAHHGHRGARSAEQGVEKRAARAVPPLGDEQRCAHSRAVGGDRGQVLIHPPGQLRDAGPQKIPQAGYHQRPCQGKGQRLEIAQGKVLQQLVHHPGGQRGQDHHRRQAVSGAPGVQGIPERLGPGADPQAADQNKVFRQQGRQSDPCQLNCRHIRPPPLC